MREGVVESDQQVKRSLVTYLIDSLADLLNHSLWKNLKNWLYQFHFDALSGLYRHQQLC